MINEKLKESRADVLYSAKLLNRSDCIYFLFEHKSSLDENTPRQILKYMYEIWNEDEKQNPSTRKIPVVLSIIVYHGEKAWNINNSIKPLFAMIEGVDEYIPDFKSEIIDLTRLSDEELGDQVELKAFLMALKYSRSPEIFKKLPEIIRMFNSLGKREADYLKVVLLYIGSLAAKNRLGEFLGIVKLEHIDGVSYMETIADALREEGRKQEREIALQKEERDIVAIVQRMLQKNISIELIHETTKLTKKRIKEIQKKND